MILRLIRLKKTSDSKGRGNLSGSVLGKGSVVEFPSRQFYDFFLFYEEKVKMLFSLCKGQSPIFAKKHYHPEIFRLRTIFDTLTPICVSSSQEPYVGA